MAARGTQRTQLTNMPQGNSDPTWSPERTHIAFVSARDGPVVNVFISRADGSDVRQITHDSAGKSQLTWSPSGDRIAFVRTPAGGGEGDIYSINADGSGLTNISGDRTSPDLEPAWSPDGTRIAYSGPLHRGESVGMDLWIMNADGSGQHELFHENNNYSDGANPAWSPDATTIAFTANNGSGYHHVWTAPASRGHNTELITNGVPGGNPEDQEVDWTAAPTNAFRARRSPRCGSPGTQRRSPFKPTGPATGYRFELRQTRHKANFKACTPPQTYKRLTRGSYTFLLIASAPDSPYRTAAEVQNRLGPAPRLRG